MRIEEEILQGYLLKEETLKEYGFSFTNGRYIKKYPIFNGDFYAEISFFKGKIKGRMIDASFDDEYALFNNENSVGEFVGRLREEYQKILLDLRDHCYRKALFPDYQAERIAGYIEKTYGVKPEFLWEKYPYFGIFRNKKNERWFALIGQVDDNKLGKDEPGRTTLNLKANPDLYNELINTKNIFPGWHMNKKSWITVSLSDYLPDEYIHSLIDMSYQEIDALGIAKKYPRKRIRNNKNKK
ncbi:MAG: hypothetical protein E7181_05330 [Erysipelotrichaceae bacterium]|nr:hypothetical protein [Erysipelotrichaceae bacterium]